MRRPHPPRLRRLVRAVAALILLALGAVAGPLPAYGAAGGTAARPSEATAGVSVTLGSLTPTALTSTAPAASDTLQLSGDIRDSGTHSWHDVRVRVSIGGLVTARSALTSVGSTPSVAVPMSSAPSIAAIAPGGSSTWSGAVKAAALVAALPPGRGGVLPLTVTLQGRMDDSAQVTTLTAIHTVIPWMPPGAASTKLNVAMLWPVIDAPRVDGAATLADPDSAPTQELTDDALAGEMSDGRLDRLVDYGGQLGSAVTWVVDPDLLDTASIMAGGYVVPDGADGTQPGTGTGAAATWLSQLRAALGAGGELDVVPSGDPDLMAVAHDAGNTQIRGAVGDAASGAAADAEQQLNVPVDSVLAWPVDGLADATGAAGALRLLAPANTGGTAASGGSRGTAGPTTGPPGSPSAGPSPAGTTAGAKRQGPVLVLSGASMAADPALNYTPSGRAEVDGAAAVVGDATMNALLADEVDQGPGSGVIDRQLLLANTALINLEQPSNARTVLLTPPRRWDVDQQTFNDLKTLLTGTPWVQPVPLSHLTALSPAASGRWTGPSYPAGAGTGGLGAAYLGRVAAFSGQLNVFSGILTSPQAVTSAFGPAVYRSLSSAWRDPSSPPGGGADERFLDAAEAGLTALRGSVSIVGLDSHTTITLAGSTGTLPITIENGLRQSVRVRVVLASTRTNRVQVTEPTVITALPSRQTVVRISAKAAANGPVQLSVSLLTPTGQLLAGPQSFWVNVTHIGVITLIVFGVVVGLLLVAVVLRFRRSRRGQRGGGPSGTPDGTGPPDGPPYGGAPPVHPARVAGPTGRVADGSGA